MEEPLYTDFDEEDKYQMTYYIVQALLGIKEAIEAQTEESRKLRELFERNTK